MTDGPLSVAEGKIPFVFCQCPLEQASKEQSRAGTLSMPGGIRFLDAYCHEASSFSLGEEKSHFPYVLLQKAVSREERLVLLQWHSFWNTQQKAKGIFIFRDC